jgi:RHS repeat-associated protein
MEYGDDTASPIPYGRGRVLKVYDGAGLAETKVYDFKGNALSQARTLLEDGKLTDIDWSSGPTLQTTAYETSALFDALNRPTEQVAPDGSIQGLTYNQSGLLESLTLKHAFEPSPRTVIANIDYNEKGQRERVSYGEAAGANACCTIELTYDAKTFRLIRLKTTRVSDEAKVQDLSYTFDAVGNITHIADAAQRTLFFDNAIIEPSNDYAYDSLYRLVEGSGREHVNQGDINSNRGNSTVPVPVLPEASDETALRNYTQTYTYDDSGNLTQMKHAAGAGSWTRNYTYHPGGNRLATTQIGSGPVVSYTHDAHGNMQSLGGLDEKLDWNHRDELASYFVGTGEPTYYQYDASGQRVRKYSGANESNYSETIYLGGFEVVSNVSGGAETRLETLCVSDGQSRVCTVERKTWIDGLPSSSPVNWRFQLGNHLGSASVELDEAGEVISYEEYHPYGSTSYRSHRPGGANLSLKRYRFTGKERDDESGLYYHGARYYAAWLGRWTAADPIGIGDGLNRFAYVRGNPILFNDPNGTTKKQISKTAEIRSIQDAVNDRVDKGEITTHEQYIAELTRALESRFGDQKPAKKTPPSTEKRNNKNGNENTPQLSKSREALEQVANSAKVVDARKIVVRKDVKFEADFAKELGISPKDPKSPVTAAEHALGNNKSNYVSVSERRSGAPTFEGEKIEIDVQAAKKHGAEFISNKELTKQVKELGAAGAVHPERVAKWEAAQKGAGGEREALFKGHVAAEAVETTAKKIIRGVGRAAGLVGLGLTAKDLYGAANESANVGSVAPLAAESIRQVGGWVGALYGFKAVAALAGLTALGTGPGALVAAFIGGLIGGTLGYFAFDFGADLIYAN